MAIVETVVDSQVSRRKQWWEHIPIPISWMTMEPPSRDRREERREDEVDRGLDDTWSRYNRRRYDESPPPPFLPQQPKIQVPLAIIVTILIWMVGQLVGSIWWAATLQSDLRHEIADRQKEESRLWQTVETYRLENNQLRVEIARNNVQLRNLKEEGD